MGFPDLILVFSAYVILLLFPGVHFLLHFNMPNVHNNKDKHWLAISRQKGKMVDGQQGPKEKKQVCQLSAPDPFRHCVFSGMRDTDTGLNFGPAKVNRNFATNLNGARISLFVVC